VMGVGGAELPDVEGPCGRMQVRPLLEVIQLGLPSPP
jgi:hypothetical protein